MAGGALAPFLSGWNASKTSLSTTTDRRAPSVERSGASQVFVALLQNWCTPTIPVHVIYAPNRYLSAKVRVFIDRAVTMFERHDEL